MIRAKTRAIRAAQANNHKPRDFYPISARAGFICLAACRS